MGEFQLACLNDAWYTYGSLDEEVKRSTPDYYLSICHWVHLSCTDLGTLLMHWKVSSTPYTGRQMTCFTAVAEGSECFISNQCNYLGFPLVLAGENSLH